MAILAFETWLNKERSAGKVCSAFERPALKWVVSSVGRAGDS